MDIKTQVTIDYGTKANFEIVNRKVFIIIVVSAPCVESMKIEDLRSLVMKLILDSNLPKELLILIRLMNQSNLVNMLIILLYMIVRFNRKKTYSR